MEKDNKHESHLFMIRFWREALGGGHFEWRGQVKHVQSGQVLYFRTVPALPACLQALLADLEGDHPAAELP